MWRNKVWEGPSFFRPKGDRSIVSGFSVLVVNYMDCSGNVKVVEGGGKALILILSTHLRLDFSQPLAFCKEDVERQ